MGANQDSEQTSSDPEAVRLLSDESLREFGGWESDQKYLAARLVRRQFYRDHPVTEIRSVPRPLLPDELPTFWTEGELTLLTRLDPCQTWSAHLIRKAFVGEMPPEASSSDNGGVKPTAHALFEAKVSGARSREIAVEAVLTAATHVGWIR